MNESLRFITVTGRPGSGKSHLNQLILEALEGKAEMFAGKSFITRPPRPDDVPGEYSYVSDEEFDEIRCSDAFLWTFSHGQYRVGTRKKDVASALASDKISLMTLVPEAVQVLSTYLPWESIMSYLCVAPDEQCIARIRRREKGVVRALARFESTSYWTPEYMRGLGVKFTVLDTSDEDPPGHTALAKVLSELEGRGLPVTRHE